MSNWLEYLGIWKDPTAEVKSQPRMEKRPSPEQSPDTGDGEGKKRRSSLRDSPLTSSSSSAAGGSELSPDGSPGSVFGNRRRRKPQKTVLKWHGPWLAELRRCVLEGDGEAFIRRVRMACIALRKHHKRSASLAEFDLVSRVMHHVVSEFYDETHQYTLLMCLMSPRDETDKCEKVDHAYCRIAHTILANISYQLRHDLLRMCTKLEHQTALHMVANTGELCQLRVLLAYDIDVNARDTSGRTALYYALERHDLAMASHPRVKMLMVYGADISRCPEGRFMLPPRTLSLENVAANGSGYYASDAWFTERVDALEAKFNEWVREMCGEFYEVASNASDLHFVRLTENSDFWCKKGGHELEMFEQRTTDLNLRIDLCDALNDPNEVAMLFMVPVFWLSDEENASAGHPRIARTNFSALYDDPNKRLFQSIPMLSFTPAKANAKEVLTELEPLFEIFQSDHFCAYELPSILKQGPYAVNFNARIYDANDNIKCVFVAMRAVVCRALHNHSDESD